MAEIEEKQREKQEVTEESNTQQPVAGNAGADYITPSGAVGNRAFAGMYPPKALSEMSDDEFKAYGDWLRSDASRGDTGYDGEDYSLTRGVGYKAYATDDLYDASGNLNQAEWSNRVNADYQREIADPYNAELQRRYGTTVSGEPAQGAGTPNVGAGGGFKLDTETPIAQWTDDYLAEAVTFAQQVKENAQNDEDRFSAEQLESQLKAEQTLRGDERMQVVRSKDNDERREAEHFMQEKAAVMGQSVDELKAEEAERKKREEERLKAAMQAYEDNKPSNTYQVFGPSDNGLTEGANGTFSLGLNIAGMTSVGKLFGGKQFPALQGHIDDYWAGKLKDMPEDDAINLFYSAAGRIDKAEGHELQEYQNIMYTVAAHMVAIDAGYKGVWDPAFRNDRGEAERRLIDLVPEAYERKAQVQFVEREKGKNLHAALYDEIIKVLDEREARLEANGLNDRFSSAAYELKDFASIVDEAKRNLRIDDADLFISTILHSDQNYFGGANPNRLNRRKMSDIILRFSDEMISRGMPKSDVEFVAKDLANHLFLGDLWAAMASWSGGTHGLNAQTLQNQGLEAYGKSFATTHSSWATGVLHGFEMVADVIPFFLSGGVGSVTTKGAGWTMTHLVRLGNMATGMSKAAAKVAAREVMSGVGARMFLGSLHQAVTLGGFEAYRSIASQMAQRGEIDWNEVRLSAAGGAGLGMSLGMSGPIFQSLGGGITERFMNYSADDVLLGVKKQTLGKVLGWSVAFGGESGTMLAHDYAGLENPDEFGFGNVIGNVFMLSTMKFAHWVQHKLFDKEAVNLGNGSEAERQLLLAGQSELVQMARNPYATYERDEGKRALKLLGALETAVRNGSETRVDMETLSQLRYAFGQTPNFRVAVHNVQVRENADGEWEVVSLNRRGVPVRIERVGSSRAEADKRAVQLQAEAEAKRIMTAEAEYGTRLHSECRREAVEAYLAEQAKGAFDEQGNPRPDYKGYSRRDVETVSAWMDAVSRLEAELDAAQKEAASEAEAQAKGKGKAVDKERNEERAKRVGEAEAALRELRGLLAKNKEIVDALSGHYEAAKAKYKGTVEEVWNDIVTRFKEQGVDIEAAIRKPVAKRTNQEKAALKAYEATLTFRGKSSRVVGQATIGGERVRLLSMPERDTAGNVMYADERVYYLDGNGEPKVALSRDLSDISNPEPSMAERAERVRNDNEDASIRQLLEFPLDEISDNALENVLDALEWRDASMLTDEHRGWIAALRNELSKRKREAEQAEREAVKKRAQAATERLARKAAALIEPVGRGVFGNMYDQFKGKVKEAFDFLLGKKEGDVLAVWTREGIGDIDLVWGSRDENAGLDHIIDKHVGEGKDFANEQEMMSVIDDVVKNGKIIKEKWDKIIFEKDGKRVVIRKNVRDDKGNVVEQKNWVVTSYDANIPKSEKHQPAATRATPNGNQGGRAVTPGDVSGGKGSEKIGDVQEGGGKSGSELGLEASGGVDLTDSEAVEADASMRERQGALSWVVAQRRRAFEMERAAREKARGYRAQGLSRRAAEQEALAKVYGEANERYAEAERRIRNGGHNFTPLENVFSGEAGPLVPETLRMLFNRYAEDLDDAVDGVGGWTAARAFRLAMQMAETLGVEFEFVEGQREAGRYRDGWVGLDLEFFRSEDVTDSEKAQVLFHEVMHGALWNALHAEGSRLSEAQRVAVEGLRGVLEELRRDKRFEGAYGVRSVDELLSEMSNPAFCELLKNSYGSWWQRFTGWFFRLFGIERGSRFERVCTAMETLLTEAPVARRGRELERPQGGGAAEEVGQSGAAALHTTPLGGAGGRAMDNGADKGEQEKRAMAVDEDKREGDLPWQEQPVDNEPPVNNEPPVDNEPLPAGDKLPGENGSGPADGGTPPPPNETLRPVDVGDGQPMRVDGQGNVRMDSGNATPERVLEYLYGGESGFSEEVADAVVEASLKAAQQAVRSHKPPKNMNLTTVAEAYQQLHNALEGEVRHWEMVKKLREEAVEAAAKAEAERKAAEEAAAEAARKAEAERLRREQEERLRKEREERERREREEAERRARLGINNVGDNIREKWSQAQKIEGVSGSRTVGGEKITGRYYLVEADAPTASHDPLRGFAGSEGYPVDENGHNINDRDYEHNENYQQAVQVRAQQYDGRAVDNVPVVSKDGVVLDGNDRTMSSQIAARNGTDGAYLEALRENAERFGFTREQVDGMSHPRVVFVPDADMPYTSETMRKFNVGAAGGKGESIAAIASAMSKTLTTETLLQASAIMDGFDRLSDISNDVKASKELVALFVRAGIINADYAPALLESDHLNGQGADLLKAVVIGSIFDAETVGVLDAMPNVKEKIVMAASHLLKNASLGDYSLKREMQEAVKLVSGARSTQEGAADPIDAFLRTGNMFEGQNRDLFDIATQLLAHVLHERGTKELREVLDSFNKKAEHAAHGGKSIVIDENGDMVESVLSKVDILKDLLKQYKYYEGAKDREQSAGADSVGQDGSAGAGGDGGSGQGEVRGGGSGRPQGGRTPDGGEQALRDALVEVMREAGMPVVVDAEGQRVLDAYRNRVRAMGSKVNRRMSEIGQSLSGIEMTVAQRMVVDVFSGIKDNQPIDVERPDGSRHVIMRQGNERGAGAKHSVFRHYGTGTGVISAVDVLKIPEVIEKGNITEKRRGNVRLVEYRYTDENGTRYTVVTEVKKKGEVFNDFYTNKKASNQTPQMPNGDTPESARTNDNDANSGAKLQKVGDSASDGGEKVSSNVLFDGAKKKFGVTSDIREAGYVLPDGTMLDFSGRHELLGADDSGIRGRRATDHRAVGQIGWMYDENGDEVETGLATDMPDFIERGAIRIDCNAGTINLATAPTAAQRKVLRELIARNDGDVQVDFGNGWDSAHYAEYSEAKATRVLGDIERYFSEGVRPKGDIQFFRTEEGEVYGFVKDGVIYLDPKLADAETAIHEYGHLWGEALRSKNPAAWARLRGEMEADAELMAYVKSLYPELEGDALIDEVFQRYAGKRGAERLRAERDRMLGQADGILGKAGVVALFDKLRRLLERFWRMSRDLFAGVVDGLDRLSGADFADMMLADLLGGFNPNAAGARGEGLVAETGVADPFYSNAARAVENIKQGKAKAEQWKAMLTKAGGIKAGEDKWMGLTQWLDEHKGETLTKEQVLAFVRENGVKMVEREYIEAPYSFESLKREYDQWLHDEGFDYAQEQLLERFGDDADIAFDDLGGELVIANEEAAAALLGSEDIINSTRLDYTTEGLDNKREIAFVVPGVEPYQESDAVHFGPENEGRAVMWVRFGETTDEDGNRVLVIDEIQSNRHQDAREKGYRERIDREALEEEEKRATSNLLDYRRVLRERYENDNIDYILNNLASTDEIREYRRLQGIRTRIDNQLVEWGTSSGVPAAPFEKNWHEVAMKRMLRLAAEEGFDKVAWTTGMQQAKRYDIGNAVERIEKLDDRAFLVYPADGSPYQELEFDEDGVYRDDDDVLLNNKTMADIFGKETAENLKNLGDGDQLTGDGLRIGGDGMRGFYDQMLPRFMDKYGKKWGVKTGEVRLSTPGGEVMHSVDVTDAMRRSVLVEGQPLFQKAEDERGRQRTGEDGLFDENMYREDDFDERQQQAVADVGTVTPDLGSVEVSIVSIERNEDGELHPFDEGLGATALKKQVKDYARTHGDEILGDVAIERGTVHVSLTSIGEMVNPSSIKNSVSKDKHLAALLKIKEIIANSVDAEVHPDYIEKDENGRRIVGRYNPNVLIHRLYGAINIDGVTYRVKTTIKEDSASNTNRAYTYEVTNIELLEDHKEQTLIPTPRTTNNSISVAKLLQGVEKSYDSGKLLLEESVKTTETGGGKLFREGRWRAGDVLRVEGGSWQEERRVRSYVTGEWETLSETHGRYRLPGFGGEYHSLEALCDALRGFDKEHVFVPTEDGTGIEVHHWTESEVLRMWRGNPGSKRFEKWVERTRKQAREALSAVADRLGVKVRVVDSLDGLEGRDRDAKGWFDPVTGEIVVVLPNHEYQDTRDVMQTLLHEAVGHYGLRELFGSDFDTFLDNVRANVDETIRRRIEELAGGRSDDASMRRATEEYLSQLAEQMDLARGPETFYEERSVWDYVKGLFIDMLRKVGFNMEIGDRELQYVLWKSHDNLVNSGRKGGLIDSRAADIAKQRALGVGNYGEPLEARVAEAGEAHMYRMKDERNREEAQRRMVDSLTERMAEVETTLQEMRAEIDDAMNGIGGGKYFGIDMSKSRRSIESQIETAQRKADSKQRLLELLVESRDDWQNNPDAGDMSDPRRVLRWWDNNAEESREEILTALGEAQMKLSDGGLNDVSKAEWQTRRRIAETRLRRLDKQGDYPTPPHADPQDPRREMSVDEVCPEPHRGEFQSEQDYQMAHDDWEADVDKYWADREAWEQGALHDYYSELGTMSKSIMHDEMRLIGDERLKKCMEDFGVELTEQEEAMIYSSLCGVPLRTQADFDYVMRTVCMERRRNIERGRAEDKRVIDELTKTVDAWARRVYGITGTTERRALHNDLIDMVEGTKEVPSGLEDVVEQIRDFFEDLYQWQLTNGTMEITQHRENYVPHVWDEELSQWPEEKRRANSEIDGTRGGYGPNGDRRRKREFATYEEGEKNGMVRKHKDIFKLMHDYSRLVSQQTCDRRLLELLRNVEVVTQVDKDGNAVEKQPLIILNDEHMGSYPGRYVAFDNSAFMRGGKPLYLVNDLASDWMNVMYGQRSGKAMQTLQNVSAFAKGLKLTFSFFHHLALSEHMAAEVMSHAMREMNDLVMGMARGNGGYVFEAATRGELIEEAASHFVKLGMESDLADVPDSDLFRRVYDWLQTKSDELWDAKEGLSASKLTAVLADIASVFPGVKVLGDKLLWDWLHDGYKLQVWKWESKHVRKRAAREGWSAQKLNRQLDELGQAINDMFGGQHFDILGWRRDVLKASRLLFLSTDWNVSWSRLYRGIFGGGGLYQRGQATWGGNKERWRARAWNLLKSLTPGDSEGTTGYSGVRAGVLRSNFLFMTMLSAMVYGLANYWNRKNDMEEAMAEAEARREDNPAFRSVYEQAGIDEPLTDETMWERWREWVPGPWNLLNSPGKRSYLFVGRDASGRERYVRFGKQAREPWEMFENDGRFDWGHAVTFVVGKSNPMISSAYELTTGQYNGWENKDITEPEDWEGREKARGRVLAEMLSPFSLRCLWTGDEWSWWNLFMPTSKGIGRRTAISEMEKALVSEDIEYQDLIKRAAALNNLDVADIVKQAKGNISKESKKGGRQERYGDLMLNGRFVNMAAIDSAINRCDNGVDLKWLEDTKRKMMGTEEQEVTYGINEMVDTVRVEPDAYASLVTAADINDEIRIKESLKAYKADSIVVAYRAAGGSVGPKKIKPGKDPVAQRLYEENYDYLDCYRTLQLCERENGSFKKKMEGMQPGNAQADSAMSNIRHNNRVALKCLYKSGQKR